MAELPAIWPAADAMTTEAIGIGNAARWARSPPAVTPGTLVRPNSSTSTQPDGLRSSPSCAAKGADWCSVGTTKRHGDVLRRPVVESQPQPVVVALDLGDPGSHARDVEDGALGEVLPLVEHDELTRDRPEQGRQVRRRGRSEDADPAPGELEPVAERALRREVTPHLLQPGDGRQLVADPGREHDGIRGHDLATREGEPEVLPVALDRRRPARRGP